MKARIIAMTFLCSCILSGNAWALCEVQSGTNTYADGTVLSGNICDTSGALKISGDIGNVTVSGADGAVTDGASPTIKATVKDYANSNPLTTILVDTNGDPATVGGGTQYAQGTASTTTDTMTMAGCVRVDTPAVASGVIDGDRARCMVDSTGRLWVHVGVIDGTIAATQSGTWNIGSLTSITNPVAVTGTFWQATQPVSGTVTANAGTGNFTVTQGTGSNLHVVCDSGCSSSSGFGDNSAFTFGTTSINPIGGVLDDTSTNTATENSAAVARITAQKALHMNLRNNSGTEIGTSGAPIRTDPTGSTTQPVSGTVTVTQGTGTNLHMVCDSGCSGSGGTSSNFGSAFPTPGTAAGFTDGTNMVAGRVVTSTPSSGDAGLVVRPINPNLAADNSTLSTAKVPVIAGTVSTSAPTWTNGNQSALSLQTDGSVRAAITNTPTVTANAGTNLNTSALLTTSAHDAAFGTAGTADTQVRTIQGIAGMTAVKVDGSAVTQPVSGTVTVTQGTGTNLHMVCDSGCSSSSGFADNGAFTFGTTAINPIGGVFDDVSPNTATENSAAIARITQNKAIHTNLRNASGTEIGTSGNPIRTDPTGTTTQPVNVAQMNGTTITMGNGASGTGVQRVTIASDSTGQVALAAGSNTVGNVGVLPVTSGGTSVCYITSAASTNATNCKGSAGQLYGYDLVNTTTTLYYLRIYNLSTSPTCSSSTGFIRTIPIPPAAAAGGAGGVARAIPSGEAYGTGLGFCLTGGGSSTDNTNAATGVYVSLNYK